MSVQALHRASAGLVCVPLADLATLASVLPMPAFEGLMFNYPPDVVNSALQQARRALDNLLANQTPGVPLPTTADEAAAMQMVGTAWLKANAPERLKVGDLEPLTYTDMDYPPGERTAMRAYTSGWNDCLSKIGGPQL